MPRLTTINPNDLLGSPSARRLVIRLSPARLTVWIGDPSRHSSSVFTTIPISPASPLPSASTDSGWASALEEAVYALPLLLDPYRAVDVIIDAPLSFLSPAPLTEGPDHPASAMREVAQRLLPPDATDSLHALIPFPIRSTGLDDTEIVISLPRPLPRFLRRSFQPLNIHSSLSLLASHALSLALSSPVVLVNCHSDRPAVDLIVVDHRSSDSSPRLISASTIPLPPSPENQDDAVRDLMYYIAAAATVLRPEARGISPDIRFLIAGDADTPLRPALFDALRPYVPSLSPAPLPPRILPLGTDVTLLPFDLTLFLSSVSSCE